MNSITAVGRLGRDADLRYTPGGMAACNIRFAVDRPRKNGEKSEAIWFSGVIWGKYGETMAPLLTKGKQILIIGELDIQEFGEPKRTELKVRVERVRLLGNSGQETQEAPETELEDSPF